MKSRLCRPTIRHLSTCATVVAFVLAWAASSVAGGGRAITSHRQEQAARAAILARYRQQTVAGDRMDAKGFVSVLAPDFHGESLYGHAWDRAEALRGKQLQFHHWTKVRAHVDIVYFKLLHEVAYLTVKSQAEIHVAPNAKEAGGILMDYETVLATWAFERGNWYAKSAKVIAQRQTMNGKPLDVHW